MSVTLPRIEPIGVALPRGRGDARPYHALSEAHAFFAARRTLGPGEFSAGRMSAEAWVGPRRSSPVVVLARDLPLRGLETECIRRQWVSLREANYAARWLRRLTGRTGVLRNIPEVGACVAACALAFRTRIL